MPNNPETASFPSALTTENDLLVWKNVVPSDATLITLSAAIAATDTTITLGTGLGAKLPTGSFVFTVEDETVFVGSRASDTLSGCVRGYEGTTAAAHALGTEIQSRVTAKSHNKLVAEVIAIQTALGANLSNVSGGGGTQTVTANTTLTTTYELTNVNPASTDITITLPNPAGLQNYKFTVKKTNDNAGNVQVVPNSTETIDGGTSYSLVNANQFVTFKTDGTNWFIVGLN